METKFSVDVATLPSVVFVFVSSLQQKYKSYSSAVIQSAALPEQSIFLFSVQQIFVGKSS